MKRVRIGIIGFGNVGHGLAQALLDQNEYFKKEFGIEYVITAIVDIHHGVAYNPEGLSLEELVKTQDMDFITNAEHPEWNAIQMIHNAETDVIVELSYTDLKTGEPAVLHCREAILSGKHIITTNKGPIALHYKMLSILARENGVKIGIEGTVMSGTPALHLGMQSLLYTGITEIHGILNGTTNYILSQMESGMDYDQALKAAQDLGIAEADPSGDVEGFDTAGKVAILSQLFFDQQIVPNDITREGITGLTPEDIKAAQDIKMRWKLIGSIRKTENGLETSVKPVMLPYDNPLANIMGAVNAIQYHTDLLGDVTLIGPGAGRKETASAIIVDLMNIFNN